MSRKTILFDLDGTLLPMEQDAFIDKYFSLLADKMAPYGIDKPTFVKAMWCGVESMLRNDGSRSNETAFFENFLKASGVDIRVYADVLESFYMNEFEYAREHCGVNPLVPRMIQELKEAGHRLVLATSPVYPLVAVCARMRWAGVNPADFELVTTYENCSFAKPNPAYYSDIAKRLQVDAKDCIMIGNDTRDDLPAAKAGMRVFILTDYLINKNEIDFSAYPHGNFEKLCEFLKNI